LDWVSSRADSGSGRGGEKRGEGKAAQTTGRRLNYGGFKLRQSKLNKKQVLKNLVGGRGISLTGKVQRNGGKERERGR